jgi:hypothetical protein
MGLWDEKMTLGDLHRIWRAILKGAVASLLEQKRHQGTHTKSHMLNEKLSTMNEKLIKLEGNLETRC